MRKTFKIKSEHCFHFLCIAISIVFVCLTIFVFNNAFIRLGEAFRDIWNSLLFYFQELFYLNLDAQVSVNTYSTVPFTPFLNLPETWEEFLNILSNFWQAFISVENIKAYFSSIVNTLYNFSKVALLIGVPLILCAHVLFKRYLSNINNNYGKQSTPLRIYKKIEDKVFVPIKNFIKNFLFFVKSNSIYCKLWVLIWLINFNFITIFVEFIAYYLYFFVAFDFISIYNQCYKLLCDLSPMLAFVPPFVWLIILVFVIFFLMKKHAQARLVHFENRNCGFVSERAVCLFFVGTMGSKKTTLITDIALSQEKLFRARAKDLMLQRDYQFPHFPWNILELDIRKAIQNHSIYNLATCRRYCYSKKIKFLKKPCSKNIFGYDYLRYSMIFDNELYIIDLWQAIESYVQLYFIYICPTSLLISNYAIRNDAVLESNGNFIGWNYDFFSRKSIEIYEKSQYSHIIDFDALRLGKKISDDNFWHNAIDFGVLNITEVGKERLNTLELSEKKKNDNETNQKNDGFNAFLKMARHSATVDYFPFIKFVVDEQRLTSLGADARELCEIVHILENKEARNTLPLFDLVSYFLEKIIKKCNSIYDTYRFNRADSTLFMYLFKKFVAGMDNFITRLNNLFGYSVVKLRVENGTQDIVLGEKKYYLMNKKIYADRFSTDCFSEYFYQKNIKSCVGINDIPTYAQSKASFDELKQQNSYFVNDLIGSQNNSQNNKKKKRKYNKWKI